MRMCDAEPPFMTHYELRKWQRKIQLYDAESYSYIASFVNMTPVYPAERHC